MKTLRVTLLGAVLMLMVACATLGLAPAKSFSDQVQYVNGELTAVVQTTTAALTSGTLTKKEAQSVQTVALQARALLDAAQEVGDVPDGQQNLSLAIALLQNLQTYLNDRGTK